MSKGLRRNFSITTNDFSLKYVLITVPVVIMPMNSLIHLLPPGGDCFFSAWVRAGPSYCVTSNGAHRPRGPSDLMHGRATPPLWCSASGSTTPLSHEKASDKPQSGDDLQGVWPVFFKWPRSWKTGINRVCPRLEEAEETQSPAPGGPWIGPWSGRKGAADSLVTLEQRLWCS